MNKLFKRIIIIISIIFMIVGLLSTGIYWYAKSTLPDYSGIYQISGINDTIKIIRDKHAVPHIYADNKNDLAFAMGYVMAEDRLWQMDLFRRVATGQLSEIFGVKTLKADRFSRILGFKRKASSFLKDLPSDQKAYLDAFVAGINKYIELNSDEIPLEFKVLQYEPEYFSSIDIMALSHFQSYASNHNWKYELLRSTAIKELGELKGRQLVPALTFYGPYMSQPGEHDKREGTPAVRHFSQNNVQTQNSNSNNSKATLISQAAEQIFTAMTETDKLIYSLSGLQGNQVHSNFWIISGKKSKSGLPILSNDYHMPFLLPSLWYELHLISNGIDAMGITLPGYPTIVAGHNQHIAWGATTTGADTQDLFWEKTNPANHDEYLYNGNYYPFKKVKEIIKYRENGKLQTEELTVKISRHGPIINSISKNISKDAPPLALQSIKDALKGQILFTMNIYSAKNWSEFKLAIEQIRTPVWNWGYADKTGNIGYKLNGVIPIRKKGYGLEPHDGWTDEFEWKGYIPFNDLPEVFNPKTGYIVSANTEVVNKKYPYLIFGSVFQLPYRAMRIESLLKGKNNQKLNQQDIRAIQKDQHSQFALNLNSYIQNALSETKENNDKLTAMNKYLKNWNGNTGTKSVANTIIQEFFLQMLKRTFANKMSKSLFKQFIESGNINYVASVLLLMLQEPKYKEWFDDPLTNEIENKNQTIVISLNAAYDSLEKYFDNDISDWQWGKIHKTWFKHQLGIVAPFKWFWNITPQQIGGDISTVNPGTYLNFNEKPYWATHGASMRHIVDFGNWQNADLIITTGQSGRWLSPYYDDQAKLWHKNKYINIKTAKKDIMKNSIGETVFIRAN